jgi:hypothetical protein
VIPPNKTTIRLFEQGTTAVKIAQPQRDTKVTLPGGMTASFPAAGTPGISISHAIVVGTNREFVFDTDANRQHDITVGSRTFHVRLDSIENRSTRTMGDMEFAFAITEEP